MQQPSTQDEEAVSLTNVDDVDLGLDDLPKKAPPPPSRCQKWTSRLCCPVTRSYMCMANAFCCCVHKEQRCWVFAWCLLLKALLVCLVYLSYLVVQENISKLTDETYAPSDSIWRDFYSLQGDQDQFCQVPIQPLVPPGRSVALVNSAGLQDEYVLRSLLQQATRVSTNSDSCVEEAAYMGEFPTDCMSETWYQHMSMVSFKSYELFERQRSEYMYEPVGMVNFLSNPLSAAALDYGTKRACKEYLLSWRCLKPDLKPEYFREDGFLPHVAIFLNEWLDNQNHFPGFHGSLLNIYLEDLLGTRVSMESNMTSLLSLVASGNSAYPDEETMLSCISNHMDRQVQAFSYHLALPPLSQLYPPATREGLCDLLKAHWHQQKWGSCMG